jgi:hypothetical protein
VKIRFACPNCQAPAVLDRLGTAPARACPACDHALDLPDTVAADGALTGCGVCACPDLYRRKDFPQWLGLSLLTVACASFFVLQVLYRPAWAWAILLGSAAFDGLLYYYVGDVVVCYRCGAQHRGTPARGFDPFELATAERYRQERLRREQMTKG